jgi:phage gp36-like protein
VDSYCTISELSKFGVRAEALRGISADDQQDAIDFASDKIDSYLGAQYTLPLINWESDLREACALIAVCNLLKVRGVNSSRPSDEQLFLDRDAVIKWLEKIAAGNLAPRVTDSSSNSTPGHVSGGARILSSPQRGYRTDRDSARLPFTGGGRR